MVIFNSTYCVSLSDFPKWENWIKDIYIPKMIGTGYFSEPKVLKIMKQDEDSDDSYSVQFTAQSMEDLLDWNDKYGEEFSREFSCFFGTDVLYFSTILEVLYP